MSMLATYTPMMDCLFLACAAMGVLALKRAFEPGTRNMGQLSRRQKTAHAVGGLGLIGMKGTLAGSCYLLLGSTCGL